MYTKEIEGRVLRNLQIIDQGSRRSPDITWKLTGKNGNLEGFQGSRE